MASGFREYVPGRLRYIIDCIVKGKFGNLTDMHGMLKGLMEGNDSYCLCWDFESYIHCQGKVDECYMNQTEWNRRSILSTARCGKFSTDRTMREYSSKIW